MNDALELMVEEMRIHLDHVRDQEKCRFISVDGVTVEVNSYEFAGQPEIIIYRYMEEYRSVCFAIKMEYCYEYIRCFADDSGRIHIRDTDECNILDYTAIHVENTYNISDVWDIKFSDLVNISAIIREYLRLNEARDNELAKKTLILIR